MIVEVIIILRYVWFFSLCSVREMARTISFRFTLSHFCCVGRLLIGGKEKAEWPINGNRMDGLIWGCKFLHESMSIIFINKKEDYYDEGFSMLFKIIEQNFIDYS